ncbi:hypothetical protein ACRAWD_01030 [Caulobacter segnis]
MSCGTTNWEPSFGPSTTAFRAGWRCSTPPGSRSKAISTWQTAQPTPPTSATGANRGFEVEAAFRVSERLDPSAAALPSTILKSPNSTSPSARARRLGPSRRLPGLDQPRRRLPPGSDRRADPASAQASYVGASYLTFGPDKAHEMGKLQGLRGIASSSTTPGWTLSATLDNALNGHANSLCSATPTSSAGSKLSPRRDHAL